MATIAENLQTLRTHLYDAFETGKEKGATKTFDDDKRAGNLSEMIDSIPTPPLEMGDVNFLDENGELVYVFTKEEASALTALPPLPTPKTTGLQAIRWNVDSLESFKKQVATGKAIVGLVASYCLTQTEIDVTLRNDTNLITLYVEDENGNKSGFTLNVDWGDGTVEDYEIVEDYEGEMTHIYSDVIEDVLGNSYTIKINTKNNAKFNIYGLQYYNTSTTPSQSSMRSRSHFDKIRLGTNYAQTNSHHPFFDCVNLTEFDFGLNNQNLNGDYYFAYCSNLKHVYGEWNNDNAATYVFYYCVQLEYLCIPHLSDIATYFCGQCNSLEYISFPCEEPEDGWQMTISAAAFRNAPLKDIALPFYNTYITGYAFLVSGTSQPIAKPNLENVDLIIPENTSITSNSFMRTGIKSVRGNLHSSNQGGSAIFGVCQNLVSAIFPVFNYSLIPNAGNMFGYCGKLKRVEFQAGSNGTLPMSTFQHCYNLRILDFRKVSEVIKLANTSNVIPTSLPVVFVIPDELYDEWTGTTNWTVYSGDQFIKASEYNEEDYL